MRVSGQTRAHDVTRGTHVIGAEMKWNVGSNLFLQII